MKALLQKIKQLLKDKRFRKIWYRGVSTIAAIVVFITTYALVLPAITMESEASCGVPAHQHSSDCYEEQLICDKEESDGHHHTDDCYTTTRELTCELPEHKHDESCRDEEGNLTCRLSEHTHEDGCYEEHKELTCTLQESDGHHHDSSCYEQVLTCGLEAHIHSTECYKEESLAVAASTSATATTAATAATASAGEEAFHDSPDAVNAASVSDSDETAFEKTELSGTASNQDADPEKSLDTSEPAGTDMTNGSDHNIETNNSEDTDTENGEKAEPADNAEITDAATAATTGVLPEPVEQEELSDGYVPTLDPINMEQVLDRHTGFYYYHADETTDYVDGKASETLESSADITAWKKVNDDTKLAPTDLIKAYFAYTIPAGRLNETNQVARYRLPSNIHLTDDQIIAINQAVNGVAAAYVDQDTLQVTDADNYNKYLGAEAVEGTRTPDETLVEGTQEYISAVVKAENVFENTLDKDGNYIDANGNIADGPGEYLGQDLIFIFTPYSIEKNQITYDKDGNPTAAGEKIAGWFACDFNTDQINWVEEELDADLDNTTAEKTADIHFAARDDSLDIEEITQTLKMTEQLAAPEEAGEEANAAREASNAETAASETTAEKAETSSTKAPAETSEEPGAETAETADSASTSEAETQEPQYRDGTLTASGDDYTITLDYTADACIPENAELQIREITKESDPEAYEACLEQAKEQVVDADAKDNTEVDQKASRFFDIEIVVKEDIEDSNISNNFNKTQKIEPKAPVNVNIQLSNVDSVSGNSSSGHTAEKADQDNKQNDPTVLHFVDNGVETIKSSVNDGYREVGTGSHVDVRMETSKDIQFEAESFSVYGVVYTSVITTTYITASGETYEITVTYDADSGIPDDAELVVSEIEPGTDDYNSYLRNTAAKLNLVSSDVSFARYFDIEIQKGGQKIEPVTPVNVQISYRDAMDIDNSAIVNVVHYAEQGVEVISDVKISEDSKQVTYTQTSFSVTGTIVGTPSAGDQRMILVKDGTRYYIVNNDASLTEVGYDEEHNVVSVVEPMLWTFENNRGTHIYFNSEATGFGTNQVASDYYRRYLDPSADTASGNAFTQENKNTVTVTKSGEWTNYDVDPPVQVETNSVTNRNTILDATSVTIDGNNRISHGNYYLGIEKDGDGTPVRLVRTQNASEAAEFRFAEASQVPSGLHLDNAVNHIDISIQGSANVTIPLAYGDYYLADGTKKSVTTDTKVRLGKAQMVDSEQLIITPEDMKRATISAYNKNGEELDDAFYITGFSANTMTAYSTKQVRIEGKFLVADLRGTEYEHVDRVKYDGNWGWPNLAWPDGNYVNKVRQARLNNIVDYTVTVLKPIEFYLTDEEGNILYETPGGDPITLTLDVPFSGSFNYWDNEDSANGGNECPPVQNNRDWAAGDIPNHDMSGMDFHLGGDNEDDQDSPLIAIEITKVIMDDEGNLIELKEPVTNTFDIYENTSANRNGVAFMDVEPRTENVIPTPESVYDGYTLIHSKSIEVDEQGMALVYDYKVKSGMYYIVERHDDESLPETVLDVNDKEWTYDSTYIETEYVRREDGVYDNKELYHNPMHVSQKYTRESGNYRSIPEVAGWFTTMQGNSKKSGFLEFFVYNIYTSNKDLPVEKEWAEGTDIPEGATVTVDLYYDQRKVKEADGSVITTPVDWKSKDQYQKAVAGQGGFNAEMQTSITLQADSSDESKNWKGAFKDLPRTVVGADHAVYEIDYYARESAVTVAGHNILHDYQSTVAVEDGKIIISNRKDNTSLDVEKTWAEGTVAPEKAEVTVGLFYDKRMVVDADGREVASPEDWKDPDEYEQVQAGQDGFDSNLVTTIKLKADDSDESMNWKGSFVNLPKTVTIENAVYEIDYYAKELSVKVPGQDSSAIDENAVDITGRYDTNEVKEEASASDAAFNDGKVTIENEKAKVTPTVQKKWVPEPDETGAYATVQLKRYMKAQPGQTTSATVRKIWEDNNDQDGKRPDNLVVTLSNGQTVTLSDSNDWTATVENLPMFNEDDELITYTWTESDVQDYRLVNTEIDGTTTILTNRYLKTSATVTKVWDDMENQDGIRPDSLTVSLLADGAKVKDVTLTAADNWTHTENDLDGFRGEEAIQYTWEEEETTGYQLTDTVVEGTQTTLTNTHVPETTTVSVAINWDDVENQDGSRPSSVTVQLSDGQTVLLNDQNNWQAEIENLPKYNNGQEIDYMWTAPAIENYDLTAITEEDSLTTFEYHHDPVEKDTVTVTIYTVLGENLPSDWGVQLWNIKADGEDISGQLTKGDKEMNNYSLHPVTLEVPKNSRVAYHYMVKPDGQVKLNMVSSPDVNPKSYNTTATSRDIMFKTGTSDAHVYMLVSGANAPDIEEPPAPDPKYMNITINLIDNGSNQYFGFGALNNLYYQEYLPDQSIKQAEYHNESVGSNKWVIKNIPVEGELGDTITYLFKYGYYYGLGVNDMLTISSPDAILIGQLEYTNQNDQIAEKLSIVAQEGDVTINVTIQPKNSTQSSNSTLAAYPRSVVRASAIKSGFEIIKDLATAGETNTAIDSEGDAVSISKKNNNLLTEAPGLESVNKGSAYSGKANNVLLRGASSIVSTTKPTGYREDKDFSRQNITITLGSTDDGYEGWKQAFPKQDKYDELGNEYIYYVEEVSCYPEDYEVSSMTGDLLTEGGVTITNTKASRTGSLKITKSVLVNGESTTGTLADGTYTFQIWNADATSQITKKADGSTDIGTLQITVTNGQPSPSELLVEELPAATYIVKETGSTNGATIIDTSILGYDTTHGGIAVTVTPDNTSNIPTAAFVNKYDTTDVSVTKIWNDNNNAKNKRPASLTVTLLENGEESGKTVTLNSSNGWTDTISGLPKYKNNAIIDYQWHEEDMPAGYFLTGTSTSGTVTTLTNTLQEYDLKTSYVGEKLWTDEGNKYSTRPDNLEVKLYANNVVTSYVPVWTKDTATNQWMYTFADIPVFDADGNIISYRAEETTVPFGYILSDKSQTSTTWTLGTAHAETIPRDNEVKWDLGSLIDLSFLIIKTTDQDFVIWTHRVPTPSELTQIKTCAENAFGDFKNKGKAKIYCSGIGHVSTSKGGITVLYDDTQVNPKVTLTFDDPSVWVQYAKGQFSGTAYNIGTTSFTNELETKDLSGTKTWEILGDTIPDNPVLTLTRTVTTDNGSGEPVTSAPETVTEVSGGRTVNLQPVWTGTGDTRTFTYSGLPKFDKNGNEYTYEVAEASFVIGSGDNAVTYTAVKASDGTYTLTPSKSGAAKIVATQTGNAITNTEVKDFEFSKIWRDMNGSDESWPISKTITVKLNASTTTTQKALADTEVVLGPEPTVLPAGWTYVTSADGKKTTFKTTNLAAKKNGEELNYYVVEVRVDGYKDPIYATSEGHSIPNGRAMDKQQVINTPEDGVELPSTGGPGTRLYYLIGTAFTALALGLIWKKRYRLP